MEVKESDQMADGLKKRGKREEESCGLLHGCGPLENTWHSFPRKRLQCKPTVGHQTKSGVFSQALLKPGDALTANEPPWITIWSQTKALFSFRRCMNEITHVWKPVQVLMCLFVPFIVNPLTLWVSNAQMHHGCGEVAGAAASTQVGIASLVGVQRSGQRRREVQVT